MICWNS